MTVANGVVLYPSMDAVGTLFFLDAASGKLLGSFASGASAACGPSVVDGVVYMGSGYLNVSGRLLAVVAAWEGGRGGVGG